MTLWTPYKSEEVLDLSSRPLNPSIKTEPCSPPPACSAHNYNKSVPRQVPPPQPYASCSITTSPPASSPESGSGRQSSTSGSSRPFKTVTSGLYSSQPENDQHYAAFKALILEAKKAKNGGSLTVTNPRMRRAVRRTNENVNETDYLQRRARNNAAAKRSRDLRKQKEDELAIQVAFLEHEYVKMLARQNEPRVCKQCQSKVSK